LPLPTPSRGGLDGVNDRFLLQRHDEQRRMRTMAHVSSPANRLPRSAFVVPLFIGLVTAFLVEAPLGCGGDDGPAQGAGTGGRSGGGGAVGQAGGTDAAALGAGGTASTGGAAGSTGGASGTGGDIGGAAGVGGGASAADAGQDDAAADGGEAGAVATNPADSVVWAIDNVQSIAGNTTTVVGAPKVIDTPAGKAVLFNGTGDALFVDDNPLTGLSHFTAEVIFRPDDGGAPAQRFFHISENGAAGNRVLFETRLPGNGVWVQDVFVQSSAAPGVALYAPQFTHPLGVWHNVTAVVDGTHARHYINGVKETEVTLAYAPHMAGQTSIGVRINKMYFFKGAIRLARFTPRALDPAEFLKPN